MHVHLLALTTVLLAVLIVGVRGNDSRQSHDAMPNAERSRAIERSGTCPIWISRRQAAPGAVRLAIPSSRS
jgi:hypothetical protein